jgi:two-component system, OmpR family, alkaline phosphatase synthesis response regulator PhoP
MKKKVLIVEDNTEIQQLMKFWVESIGYQALTADDGIEAIDKVRENRPDLILMDFMLPVLDGISAARKIRESEGDQIPILLITSFDVIVGWKEAGCNVLIPKPVDFGKLATIMNQYLM